MICDDIWVWDGVGENVEAKRTQTLVICIADPTKRQSKHNFIYFFIYFDWIFIYFLGIDWIFQPNYGKSPFFMGKSTIEMVIFQAFHISKLGRLPSIHPSQGDPNLGELRWPCTAWGPVLENGVGFRQEIEI